MKSSWQDTASTSRYHFDRTRQDPRWDTVIGLGQLDASNWGHDIDRIVKESQPATWETRGYKGEGNDIPSADLAAEEYDLERIGADPKMEITNLNWNIPASLMIVARDFALKDHMVRLHVQWPGQVWTRHIDKLQKWAPESPADVLRIFVQLTDWQPGQFWEFGNYQYRGWRAGEAITFDWQNVPHCTANAGHHPRVTMQITGVRTSATERYLNFLKNSP